MAPILPAEARAGPCRSAAIVIALCIAGVKGGLVAAFFMHLKGERPLITYCLLMTAIFFFGLILLP
ncbi:MAG: hypothetical protein CFH39_02043, partial [Alphaproteobacteria bacterium MarineAlpha10_Bin2]